MKTIYSSVAAVFALCAAQAFSATHTEVTKAPRLPFMRGINFDGYFQWRNDPKPRDANTYSNLVAKGFDHIRLPIDFRHFCTYDSSTKTVTFVDTYANGWGGSDSQWASSSKSRPISYIDQAIDLAEQYGMYIYIDGTHGWKDDLYPTDADCTNRFIAIWKAVADRYKNRSNKVIFELMSEQGKDFSGFNTLHRNTIKEIRKVDPTRLILFSSHDGSQPWVLTQAVNPPKFTWIGLPQNDNNIAVAVHCYNPSEFTHQGVTWSSGHSATNIPFSNSHRATLNQDLKWCEQWLNGTGVPIVMNEYNVENKVAAKADITEYLSIVTGWCEEHKVPWAPWIYYSDGGMDCFDRYGQLLSYIKPGLFPNLKPTDEYSASDFAHYAEVTFSGYAGSSALANFPVLVKLSERLNGFRYADFQRKDGLDLCFTDANGKLLAHEIDTWNTNGVSTVWVKVPSLTSSTKIVARYGCAKPIVPKVESVWDSDYVGVWHMGEQKLPLADSSNVSRDVTSADGTGIGYGSSGIVGGSVDFGATGAGRCVNADDHANLDGFQKMTIEAWTYQTSRPSGSDKNTGIISKRNSSSSQASYYLYDNGDAQKTSLYVSSSGSSPQAAGNLVPTALNTWNHQVHTFDGSQSSNNAKGYLNGEYKSSGTANVSQIFAGSAELHIGSFQSGDARNFPGKIDEVRISKCVRSADWIKASHDTVAKADFATYAVDGVASPDGPEEPVLPPVEYGPLATNQYAKSMNVLFAGAPSNATLTNFPVLVKLSTAIDGFSYADFRRPNGGDLRFADANGTLLPHEIDTWNQSGVSTVWVKVPLLKKHSYITAHYGFTGSGNPAPVDPKDVWDDDYVGVWHLGEGALPLKESSETSSDFESSYGKTINYATNGIVGRAIGFPAGGLTNAVVAADHDSLDGFAKFTIEFWTFQNEHKQNAGILSKRKAYNNDAAYYLYDSCDSNTGAWSIPFCIGTNKNTAARWSFNLSQTLGAWNHIVYSADLSSTTKNVHGFKNGTMNGWEPNVTFFGPMPNSAEPLILGNLGANNKDQSFNGSIDEVRISKTVRSKEWVKATYDTIANTDFAVCSFGELDFGESVSNLLLKASTDKENPIDYVENENIRFDFRLDGVATLPLEVRAKEPLHIIWTRTADDGVTVKGTNTISLAQGCSVTTKLAIPGIVRMTGDLVGSDYKKFSYIDPKDGKTTKYVSFGGGAGVATEKMQLSSVEPADFDQFWREAKQKLATVPFNDSNVELVDVTPASLTNQYYIYAAKVPCFGPRPVTGWLTVPRKPNAGGVPIQANFDGYGCATTAPKVPTYGAGQCVRFAVNAHGYDMIGHDDKYYKDFSDYINYTNRTFNGTRYGYACAPQDYDNPTNTYFYYMAMRIMRAYQYLKTRPEWNGRDVVAEGGSQGGLQTMWAGGLVDGITKIRPSITWGCDIGCPWNGNGPYPSRTWGIPSVPGAYYFDSALHAKRVPRNCIAEITRLGMGDYTCPPRGVLLSYYNMKCAVSAKLVQGSDHGYIPPQPNQQFTISKAAEPEPVAAFASDTAGFDYTNRVVTVTNAAAGATLTLTATASDGTTTTATAAVNANGEATFDIATAPGASYDYTIASGSDTIASGGFFTGGWGSGSDWFSASAAGGASAVSGGAWESTPTIDGNRYAVDGSAEFALSAEAAAAGASRFVRVDFNYSFASFCDADGMTKSTEPEYGGFAAAARASTGAALWMASGEGGWIRLYGDIAPQANTPYVVRAEADFAGNPPQIRYAVSADHGATFAPLYTDAARSERWVTGAVSGSALSCVAFDGQGSVASLGGTFATANIAEADGVGYESLADAVAAATNSLVLLTNATWPTNTPVGTTAVTLGDYALQGVTLDGSGKVVVQSGYSQIPGSGRVNISLAQAAALGVATSGKTPAQIAEALAEDGANGIPRWQSYVLGLDPAQPDAKPAASIVVNGDKVELALVGIDVNDSAGATVTYKVYKSADLADIENAQPLEGDHAFDEAASLPKSATEPRMFYRLTIDVKGY